MNAIIKDLQTLVPNVLNSATADSLSKVSPLDRVWSGFPSAVVIPPIVSGNEYEDSANNTLEYTWYVMIVTTPASLPSNDPTYLAGLEDQVIAAFNADLTLQGTANAAVYPVIVEAPGPVNFNGATYIVFYISLKARVTVPSAVQ